MPGETYVHGQDPITAQRLLDAAEQVGQPAHVVRTHDGGFLVPDAVWDAAEASFQPPPHEEF